MKSACKRINNLSNSMEHLDRRHWLYATIQAASTKFFGSLAATFQAADILDVMTLDYEEGPVDRVK